MSFSARGYATLNEKLAPDLAVLEGGYSIETALPYVNMGIIMALAGLDYSHLCEPDYKREYSQEAPGRLREIKKTVQELYSVFQHREQLVEDARQRLGSMAQRNRHIYYDTDQISEEQVETLRICGDCPGYLTIDSAAAGPGGPFKVYCISIPIQACPRCQEEGREKYGKMIRESSRVYDHIYLQDKLADEYRQYDQEQGDVSIG